MSRRRLRTGSWNTLAQLDIGQLTSELAELPAAMWNAYPWRTRSPRSPHRQASDLLLRFQDMQAIIAARKRGVEGMSNPNDVFETIPYPAWWRLPAARSIVWRLMRTYYASRIGRVVITSLAPGCEIAAHADDGLITEYYDRFQVAITAASNCFFIVDGVQHAPKVGEVFWFDNRRRHAVMNASDITRLTLIVDLRVEDYGHGWREPATDRGWPATADPALGRERVH